MPVRPKQPPVALLHPELQTHVVPVPSKFYSDDDPLVLEYPWAFGTEEELLESQVPASRESVPIESATARPGEKRNVRKAARRESRRT